MSLERPNQASQSLPEFAEEVEAIDGV